jgi:hypothetical protein
VEPEVLPRRALELGGGQTRDGNAHAAAPFKVSTACPWTAKLSRSSPSRA